MQRISSRRDETLETVSDYSLGTTQQSKLDRKHNDLEFSVQELNKLSLKEQQNKFDRDLNAIEVRLQYQHEKYNKYLKPS